MKDKEHTTIGTEFEIGGETYTLARHLDTSAPCSQCAFLDSGTLSCRFPADVERRCESTLGSHHGWDTLEYRRKMKI